MTLSNPQYGFAKYYFKNIFWFILGAFIAAFGVEFFLIPNKLVDGGIVGLAIMAGTLLGPSMLPIFLIVLNVPFVFLAYKQIGRHFVIQMLTAVAAFAIALYIFSFAHFEFHSDTLEVIVLAGFIIGVGTGIIIRHGGSTDGTEILGIIINRKKGFTVGQVILFANVFIFVLAGIIYQNWHSAFLSLMVYVVATKVMDIVIMGFEDTKSAMIISKHPQDLADVIMKELGIGLTIMYGRGGFSGEEKEILYIVVERLQLAELKEIVRKEDPSAFIAVENLHEVINGQQNRNIFT